jgi:hypothetical protein
MNEEKKLALTQVGIGQLVQEIMEKINSEGGPEVESRVDNQLRYVDVFLANDPDGSRRARLTIFEDFQEGKDYNYIVARVESSIRDAIGGLYVVCPKCGEPIKSPLMGEADPVSHQVIHYQEHVCEK